MANGFINPVNPQQPAQALIELEARTEWLRDAIDAAVVGQAVVKRDEPCSPQVLPGNAVFWNNITTRYEPAVARLEPEPLTGVLVAANSAECLGICLSKESDIVANIVTYGHVDGTPSILTALTGTTTPLPGLYYLSMINPGRVVKLRPSVQTHVVYIQAPALNCGGSYVIFVIPQTQDFLDDHIHLQFDLTARPAGTHVPPAVGAVHIITSPNPAIAGWLPAGHAVFAGSAPAGAFFGYNIAQQPALQASWPPVPAEAVTLEFTDSTTLAGTGRVGAMREVVRDYYAITDNTIWWMTNCNGQIPWDPTLNTGISPPTPPACGLNILTRMVLSFNKALYANKDTAVLRLRGDAGNVIQFKNPSGVVAETGILNASLNVAASVSSTNAQGARVLKTLATPAFTFTSGNVTEGLIVAGSEFSVSSSESRLSDVTAAAGPSNPVVHQGIVSLAFNPAGAIFELVPNLTWLGDTLQRDFRQIRYTGFPNDRTSKLTLRFDIPYDSATAIIDYSVQFKVLMFGRAVGPMSAMTAEYYVMPRPTNLTPDLALSTISLPFDVVTPSTGKAANTPFFVNTAIIAARAGDTVFLSFTRTSGVTPTYNQEIGFIRVVGLLAKATGWTVFPN